MGLANYAKMLSDDLLQVSTLNTIGFAFVSVAIEVVVGLMVAMVLCSDTWWSRVSITVLMIPMIMAPVAIGTLWRMMLDPSTGIINYFLSFFGVDTIQWLANPLTAKIAVVMVNVWQLVPWVTVIAVAGLKALPGDLIQAALIDGATPRQVFWHIVLPLIRPVLVIIVMMRFTDAFKVFDTIYVMTNGGPGTATEMLPNFIYKQGLKYYDAGYAAALAIVFVVTMTLVTLFFLRLRRKEEENVW
ncbi:MAG: sugar ABC transporter permease [Mobiluncus sp.]|nr:sugar ABC transporter permease [Mobiluncus sp.]